jgi:beta-aspartyl-peptidase (threonine type)
MNVRSMLGLLIGPPGDDQMIIVASANGIGSIKEAMRVLAAGGSAVDAVESGIRMVEANPQDHTVGLGGYPNLLGQVELDAGIMDGRDLAAGAVGALQGIQHPISVARKIMEHLPHVLLVGDGARRFAAEMGFEPSDLVTDAAQQTWEEHLRAAMPAEVWRRLSELPDLWRWVEIATDPERARGTVNFLAQDAQGNLCAGASTSGWAWKYPGRLGDSPLIGAGLYADNRYGAAACTGMGEMAIRAGTARTLVHYLRMGLPLDEAGRQTIADLNDLGGRYRSHMHLIALDRRGHHAAFSTDQGRTYVYLTGEMREPEERARIQIPVNRTWG